MIGRYQGAKQPAVDLGVEDRDAGALVGQHVAMGVPASQRAAWHRSMHDLRHTCAVPMLRDVQVMLGHAHLSTTEIYLVEDDEVVIDRVRRHHIDRQETANRLGTTLPTLRSCSGRGNVSEGDHGHDAGQRDKPMAEGP
ncbi:hypothetical protein ACQEVF_44815 [Nonomuraea polychroma]|uniref:hypothetical protein n=1 Tax=Nonomuraea polychroma TaxID=46176 RepID=UPI003D936409